MEKVSSFLPLSEVVKHLSDKDLRDRIESLLDSLRILVDECVIRFPDEQNISFSLTDMFTDLEFIDRKYFKK